LQYLEERIARFTKKHGGKPNVETFPKLRRFQATVSVLLFFFGVVVVVVVVVE
jgi:hypothetical protein